MAARTRLMQSVGARSHRQLPRGPRAGLAAEEQAEEFERFIHPHRLTAVGRDDAREALAEDALRTQAVVTAKAAGAEFEADRDAVPGQVGDCACVIAVDAC